MKKLFGILILLLVACNVTKKATQKVTSDETATHEPIEPNKRENTNYPREKGMDEDVLNGGLKTDPINQSRKIYKDAYLQLTRMLEGTKSYSFKEAVFISENAFFENKINRKDFERKIDFLTDLAKVYAQSHTDHFLYDREDKPTVLLWASVFNVMMDSIAIRVEDTVLLTEPFSYDFEDVMGQKDWSNMFVIKLLNERKGNCHSLPYLYKIIAEELGVSAHLAIAPNHIYIKHRAEKTGMYNTELTSATFPVDAWLMASSYIHTDAIRSGIYMDRLSNKQSVALCLLDLAKGFERKYGHTDDAFISKCLEKVLEQYPNCINALLFKSELLKRKMSEVDEMKGKELFTAYENLIVKIYRLGYRKMPEEMYLEWLLDLKENKEKYINKKVMSNFKTNNSN